MSELQRGVVGCGRFMSRRKSTPGAGACLSIAALIAGCGARSSLDIGETAAQGGGASTSTAGSTSSTSTSITTTSTTTITTTSTTTITTTSTTTTANLSGCADGQREGFVDLAKYPWIAGCSGGFQVPGLLGGLTPTCNFGGGDDGANPSGLGCSAWDLCAPGWHVCKSAAEVAQDSPTGCDGSAPDGAALFFAVRQSGTGCGLCALGSQSFPECETCSCVAGCLQTDATANDVFGCGSIGIPPGDCGVLDRFSNDGCGDLGPPWSCGNDGCNEANAVSKSSSEGGGVLCCADMLD